MYKQRWQIETMYKGLKSSGFNIEDSHVRIQERMANLFAIVMLAYVWCYLDGIYIHENIKKIKVLHHGRRAKSLFKYGLEYIAQCLLNHMNRYRIDISNFFVIYLGFKITFYIFATETDNCTYSTYYFIW